MDSAVKRKIPMLLPRITQTASPSLCSYRSWASAFSLSYAPPSVFVPWAYVLCEFVCSMSVCLSHQDAWLCLIFFPRQWPYVWGSVCSCFPIFKFPISSDLKQLLSYQRSITHTQESAMGFSLQFSEVLQSKLIYLHLGQVRTPHPPPK